MVTKEDFQLCSSVTEEEAKSLYNDAKGIVRYTSDVIHNGIRIIAVVKNGQVALMNERGHNPYKEFAEVVEDLKLMPDVILDGEIMDYTDTLSQVQKRASATKPVKQKILMKEIPVKFLVFDILQLNGETCTGLTLRDRIMKLEKVFVDYNNKFPDPNKKTSVVMSDFSHDTITIKDVLAKAHIQGKDGIIIKNLNSTYDGKRTNAWLKCRFFKQGIINVTKYELNPKGIIVEDNVGNRCLVFQSDELNMNKIKQLIDAKNEVKINIQYLQQNIDGRYSFISFSSIVDNIANPDISGMVKTNGM